MDKQIILGNSISGLIWGFFNPDSEVIGPTPKNSPDQYSHSNMIWLHDTPETRLLCHELGISDIKPREARIGYWDTWITEILSDSLAAKLIRKKMTAWDEVVDDTFEIPDSKMSMTSSDVNVPYMNVLGVDTAEILFKLRKIVKTTDAYVVGIDGYRDLVCVSNDPTSLDGIWISYTKLVSTIPAHVFWKIYQPEGVNHSWNFKSIPITNIVLNNKPPGFDERYEMIYYNEEFRWTRASYMNGKFGLEFTGIISEEQFKEMYPDLQIIEHFTNPYGRLIAEKNYSPSSKIIFSGRFAQWNHGITTEHVVKDALDN